MAAANQKFIVTVTHCSDRRPELAQQRANAWHFQLLH